MYFSCREIDRESIKSKRAVCVWYVSRDSFFSFLFRLTYDKREQMRLLSFASNILIFAIGKRDTLSNSVVRAHR